jgi:hypothetical protein
MVQFQELLKMYFSTYTGTTYTAIGWEAGWAPEPAWATCIVYWDSNSDPLAIPTHGQSLY